MQRKTLGDFDVFMLRSACLSSDSTVENRMNCFCIVGMVIWCDDAAKALRESLLCGMMSITSITMNCQRTAAKRAVPIRLGAIISKRFTLQERRGT